MSQPINTKCHFDNVTTLGVISDTHGLLRQEAIDALQGSDLILHAGDIGKHAVVDELRQIAPTIAVRGNIDHGSWAEQLPEIVQLNINELCLCLLHNINMLPSDPQLKKCNIVIHGHSHKPRNEMLGDVLYFNPGSAGPRRFSLPVALGRILFVEGEVRAKILEIG